MMVPRSYMRPNVLCDEPVSRSPKNKKAWSTKSAQSSAPTSRSTSPSAKSVDLSVTSLKEKSPTIFSPSSKANSISTINEENSRPVITTKSKSEPMSIPTRKPSPEGRIKTKSQRGASRSREVQDSSALPPAVAALLAVTAIPPQRRKQTRSGVSLVPRKISPERVREEWNHDVKVASSFGPGSPLDFLLEPADGNDILMLNDEYAEKQSMTMTSRSVSTESIMSTPSSDAEVGTFSSLNSSFSTPTPSLRRASRSDRKVCSPPAEEVMEHPLLGEAIPEEHYTPQEITSAPAQLVPVKQRSRFKSNLTASLQALRSAAKAFSNFTAPSLPSDDFLTRSLFSSQRYASEMRPRNFGNVPDPALRRYLNPTPALTSPDFHTMLPEYADVKTLPDGSVPPMIPMQTYTRTRGNGKNRRAPSPEKTQEAVLSTGTPMARQREPRENSDFLRVIVLEMNMRRIGKLDSKAAGRARVWLPPRRAGEVNSSGAVPGMVPMRWVGVTIDELEEED